MLTLAALFCFSAPLWTNHVQQFHGQNLFLEADSIVWLGIILSTGVLFDVIPSFYFKFIDSIAYFIKKHFKIFSVLYLLLLFTSLALVNQKILHSFMNSADEHSCYFLAECIRHGKFWAIPHPFSEFFDVVHVGNKAGKWFSVYPPGWPFFMAIGLQLNVLDLINPVLSIFSVVLFYKIGKKLFSFFPTILGILFASMTPFFLLNNASYFSHTTCLLFISIFLFSYLKWEETQKPSWAVLAAFAVGYGLGTRYLTMAAVVGPFLISHLMKLIQKREKWTKSHTCFMFVFLIMFLFNFYFNYVITGNPFNAPNHYYHGWERLGFNKSYTIITALIFILARFFYLINWIPSITLFFYLFSLLSKTNDSLNQKLFRFGFFYPVIGYMFYYSWGGNQYGPRYYFEGIFFLYIAAAERISFLWKNRPSTKKLIVGMVFASIICNTYLIQKQFTYFEQASRERKSLYALAEKSIKHPSVVFVRGFLGDKLVMSQEDAIRNNPSLNAKILYAADLKKENIKLIKYFPNREFYLGYYDRPHKLPKLEFYQNEQ